MEGNNCAWKLIFVVETAQNTVYTEIANMRYEEFNNMQLLQLNTHDPLLEMGIIRSRSRKIIFKNHQDSLVNFISLCMYIHVSAPV